MHNVSKLGRYALKGTLYWSFSAWGTGGRLDYSFNNGINNDNDA